MKKDPEFGEFWQIIYDEFLESKRLLLKIAGHKELMENYPDGKASIQIRAYRIAFVNNTAICFIENKRA
jgi:phosphoenolpyruvate carboxylase